MSNKSQPQRKFTQTFVLAEQLNGYFVLNDIFRYIIDDEDEEEATEGEEVEPMHTEAASGHQEEASAVEEIVPGTLTNSEDPAVQEHDASIVDKGLEEAIKEDAATEEVSKEEVNGEASVDSTEPMLDQESSAEVPASDSEPVKEVDIEELKTEEITEPEKPQDPVPTPLASPPKAAAQPAAPAPAPTKPALPKTWANLVAGNKLAAAAVPTIPAASASAPTPQPKSAPPPAPTAQPALSTAAQTAPATQVAPVAQDTEQNSGSEWQTAGHDHGKKQTKPQSSAVVIDGNRGYIKNVGENIDAGALRAHLNKLGEVLYFDVNRAKVSNVNDF